MIRHQRSAYLARHELEKSPQIIQLDHSIRSGTGFPVPEGNYWVDATPFTLVRDEHLFRWGFIPNTSGMPDSIEDDVEVYCPTAMKAGDYYPLFCYPDTAYYCHLHPQTGQTLMLPSTTITSANFMKMGHGGTVDYPGMWQMYLVCKAVGEWVACFPDSSEVGP